MQLQQYHRHGIAQAARIIEVYPAKVWHPGVDAKTGVDTIVIWDAVATRWTISDANLFSHGTPEPGDYWVKYEDGRTEMVPKALFERDWSAVRGPILL